MLDVNSEEAINLDVDKKYAFLALQGVIGGFENIDIEQYFENMWGMLSYEERVNFIRNIDDAIRIINNEKGVVIGEMVQKVMLVFSEQKSFNKQLSDVDLKNGKNWIFSALQGATFGIDNKNMEKCFESIWTAFTIDQRKNLIENMDDARESISGGINGVLGEMVQKVMLFFSGKEKNSTCFIGENRVGFQKRFSEVIVGELAA
ncbi:MAG: hypothetical protein WC806_06555 [Candidatus Gracilibacteria bacterium]|jgi:hypothetical protein